MRLPRWALQQTIDVLQPSTITNKLAGLQGGSIGTAADWSNSSVAFTVRGMLQPMTRISNLEQLKSEFGLSGGTISHLVYMQPCGVVAAQHRLRIAGAEFKVHGVRANPGRRGTAFLEVFCESIRQ